MLPIRLGSMLEGDEEATVLRPTTDELATLLAAGLEPREGVPGLFLCRDEEGTPIVPPGIKLEGGIKELASAMRDELVTRVKKSGTKGLPTSTQYYTASQVSADLMGVWLQGADLIRAQLQGVNLYRAQLQNTNLYRAQLQGAKLFEAQLQGAHLSEAELKGADLGHAKLQGADLEAAQLEDADLCWAQLQQASLVRAKLPGANLAQSNLEGTDFRSADLTKANLNQALASMRNYRPPRHARAAKLLTQADDFDDDDHDSSGSEDEGDDDDSKAELPPWLEAAEGVAAQAAGALVAVAQPVLLVVNSTVAELELLCDALSERVPEALVQSVLPLLEKRPALSAAQ